MIGLWGAVILTLLRLIQGIGVVELKVANNQVAIKGAGPPAIIEAS